MELVTELKCRHHKVRPFVSYSQLSGDSSHHSSSPEDLTNIGKVTGQ
jgi:hypothetical protein